MDYINTVQASKKWNITTNRITILAKAGRIEGAIQIGTRWLIPKDAKKPIDGRTKQAKSRSDATPPLRFFIFDSRPADEFDPPLTEDELKLRSVFNAVQACEYYTAAELLSCIDYASLNRYNRLYYLLSTCVNTITLGKSKDFFECLEKMNREMQCDFIGKNELMLLSQEVHSIIGVMGVFNDLRIDPTYTYHDSFIPHLVSISLLSLIYSNKTYNEQDLIPYEIHSTHVDNTSYFIDALAIHMYLGIIYGLMNKTEEMTLHLRKALQLGMTHQLYWLPSMFAFYYRSMIEPILASFPKEYYDKILLLSNDMHERYTHFMEPASENTFFKILLANEYIYVFYAVQGYTNKEVADILGNSESAVSNKYSKIYDELNVSSKKELVEYYLNSIC